MTNTASKNTFDSASIILSALAISAIGALFYNILPLYLGTAQDFRNLGNREIGFISSAFFLGYNAVTIWAFFWIRRWNWRIVTCVALPVALLGLLAGTRTQSYPLLLLTTVVAGGGFAAIYGIGTTILADTSNPARWYGVKIAAEAFPGAVLLFVLPITLIPSQGFSGAAYGIAIAALLLMPLLLTLPAHGLKEREAATEQQLQKELADMAGIPASSLCNIERGKYSNPTWEILTKIARGLDCEISEFFASNNSKISPSQIALTEMIEMIIRERVGTILSEQNKR